jgi:osmoprotectant transport system permease protein
VVSVKARGIVETIGDGFAWLTTAAHWSGGGGIVHRLWEHVAVSVVVVAIAMTIAMPIGVVFGHTGRGGFVAINITNIGRALPSFGLLVLFALVLGLRSSFGFGVLPIVLTLVLLAIPPIVTNTYVGVREVDADVREAARGMGMTGMQVLRRVELPLALPLIMAGLRTSAVQVVATATLGAAVAWGGLGRFIVDGFSNRDNPQIFGGAVIVALLAVVTDGLFALLQHAAARRRLDR